MKKITIALLGATTLALSLAGYFNLSRGLDWVAPSGGQGLDWVAPTGDEGLDWVAPASGAALPGDA